MKEARERQHSSMFSLTLQQSALHITNAVEAAAMPTLPSQRPSLRRTSSTFARAAPPRMARGKSVSAMGTTVTSRKTDRSVSCDESSRLQALNSYRQVYTTGF